MNKVTPHTDMADNKNNKTSVKEKIVGFFQRQDVWVWFAGMVFIGILCGLIMAVGNARGWDAQSGYNHNESLTSADQFLPEPFIREPGVRGRDGIDATGRWYYWKIPPGQTNFWTHFFPWVMYLSHQVLIWGVIYYAQITKAKEPLGKGRYSTKLSPFNWVAFGLNVFFHLMHFLNTHTTYDGTAQDVSVCSSQGSVIMIMVLVIILEYKERGVFFGWPTLANKDKVSQTLRLNYGPVNLVRRHHGYAFAWGMTYTFWYHPMENTVGHILGFMYTWMVLLQGSLMYTEFHLNKYWRMLQEMWVVLHGGLVAYQTGGPAMMNSTLWPMFAFGFGMCFVLTQVFSAPFWKHIPWFTRIIPLLVYIGVTLWAYSWIPDRNGRTWVRLQEIIRIPGTYYGYFIFAWALLYILNKGCSGINRNKQASPLAQVLYLMGALLIYGIHIGVALAVEYGDFKFNVIALMIIFVGIYLVGGSFSIMFLRLAIPIRITDKGKRIQRGSSNADSDAQEIVNNEELSPSTKDVKYEKDHLDVKKDVVNGGVSNTAFQVQETNQTAHL